MAQISRASIDSKKTVASIFNRCGVSVRWLSGGGGLVPISILIPNLDGGTNPLDRVASVNRRSLTEVGNITQNDQKTASPRNTRNKRILQGLLSAAVVIAVFFFALPKIADFSDVWKQLKAMSWIELGTLLVAALWNIVSYWWVVMSSLPGSNFWQVMKVTSTSTAVANSLPGGGAIGVGVTYGMYAQYGFSKADISLSILVTGVWNNFVKLGMPVVALLLLVIQGKATSGLVVAALVGLAALAGAVIVFALILKSESAAVAVGERLGRIVSSVRKPFGKAPAEGWGEGFARFRRDCIGLLRARWLPLSLSTLVSHLSLYLVLLLSLRHVGVSEAEVSAVEVLAAFSFIRLVTALPITPGGLGVVELGATAALVAAGGDEAAVVAAVLVYRALTYLLPIPFGLMTYLRWRQGSQRRKRRVDVAEGNALAAEDNFGE